MKGVILGTFILGLVVGYYFCRITSKKLDSEPKLVANRIREGSYDGYFVDGEIVEGGAMRGYIVHVKGKVQHFVDKGGLPVVKLEGNIFCSLEEEYVGKLKDVLSIGREVEFAGIVVQNFTTGLLLKPSIPTGSTFLLLDPAPKK